MSSILNRIGRLNRISKKNKSFIKYINKQSMLFRVVHNVRNDAIKKLEKI